jgi:hypothetical protein
MVTPRFIVGVEYNYVWLTTDGFSTVTSSGVPFNINGGDVNTHAVLARASYKFR